jgi:hypothetical protein
MALYKDRASAMTDQERIRLEYEHPEIAAESVAKVAARSLLAFADERRIS